MTERMSIEAVRAHGRRVGGNKYGSVRTTVDDLTFPSKAEAARYVQLKQWQDEGVIEGIELQPRWDLHGPNGKKVGRYTADFRYRFTLDGKLQIEDVKGRIPHGLSQRLKHMADEYGIEVILIRMDYREVNTLLAFAAAQGRITEKEVSE